MIRKALCLILILSTAALEFAACERAAVKPAKERSEAELDALLERDPEVQEIVAMKDDLLQRAIDRDLSSEDLVRASRSKDAGYAARLLGYTDDEAAAIQSRIESLRSSLAVRYPEIERMAREAGPACPTCDVDAFAARWNEIKAAAAAGAPARPPLTCRWSQVIIGFFMCAVASGGNMVTYTICAYVVFCHNCEGSIVDFLC